MPPILDLSDRYTSHELVLTVAVTVICSFGVFISGLVTLWMLGGEPGRCM